MFKCIKNWLLGRTPDYQSVGSKMASLVYYDESKPTNRTAIVKMSRVGPVALLDTSKRVSSPTKEKEEKNVQLVYNILTQLDEVVWAVPNTLNYVVTKILTGLTEQDICLLLAQTKDPKMVQLILDCRLQNQ